MKTKLIMFEGIPGSGKSTIAHKSTLILKKKKVLSRLYREGELHPANLDGYAVIPESELDILINKFPQYKEKICNHMIPAGNHILIQRQKDYRVESAIFQYLNPYAVWGNYIDYELFCKLHQERWTNFTGTLLADSLIKDNETVIFECAFLQDHITELMMFYEKSKSDIIEYFKKLEESISALEPFLFYLQQNDVSETIERITKQRINDSGGRPWGERVAEMIANCSYGKTHSLNGYDGMVEFFKRRKEMDLAVLNALEIRHTFIDNDNYDWKAAEEKVSEILISLAGHE